MKTFEGVLITIFVIVIAILFGVLAIFRSISSDAIAAFIGVLAGAAISSFVQYRISEADRQHQLRTAALERRLQTHQQAYALWRRLLFANRDDNELFDTVLESEKWWNENCLYLTVNARNAFLKAFHAANDHAYFLKIHSDARIVKSTWNDLERAGSIIVQGVSLPPINGLESKKINSAKLSDS
jgi:hypothetical protein